MDSLEFTRNSDEIGHEKNFQKKPKRACTGLINLYCRPGFRNKTLMNELSSPAPELGPIGQALDIGRG
jgi:hypothetical protein